MDKMETSYGVGINNRYALFLDEEGEESEDLLIKANKEAKAVVKDPKAVKKAVPVAAPVKEAVKEVNKQNNNRTNNKRVQDKNERNTREGGNHN